MKVTFARNPCGGHVVQIGERDAGCFVSRGLNADVKMKTMNGGMYTDFPVVALPVAAEQPEHRNGNDGVAKNRMTAVRIGSGGPELSFETLNGEVLIRNREK